MPDVGYVIRDGLERILKSSASGKNLEEDLMLFEGDVKRAIEEAIEEAIEDHERAMH